VRRRYWRASALAGLLGLITSVSTGMGIAFAHPVDDETDTEHAKEDLASTSIEKIEKQTKANATKIKEETGHTPGRKSDEQTVPNARVSAAAAQDPGQGGSWSSVLSTSVVPIFQAVLPNGKVLIWDSVGQGAPEQMPDNTFTRAMVWDPTTNTSVRWDVSGYNIFCAGYTQLADGRVLVAGGNKNTALDGIVQTHIFDWRKAEQNQAPWSRGPDMAAARWYPAVQALGNDEAVIVGGGPTVPEVYQTNNTLRRLTNASGYSDRLYAFLTTRPNGQVELMGPPGTMNTINTSGTGAITATKARDNISRTYGGFATYDIGKVLVAGGGSITEGGQSNVPTKTAMVVNVNGSGTAVSSTASMSVGRRQHNLTILADGSVLATGGMSRATTSTVDLNNPVFAAERWNPSTGTWTVLSSASRVREYHSSATLLPDGRVLTGGGGVCATCVNVGYLEKNVEYFEPPYLYKNDGSGQKATRPVIGSAPATATYGEKFDITSSQAGSIAKVGLVRLGAATHSQDQGQRYVPLTFDPSGSTITATAPANSNIAPAGYYMLFITDNAGVPSVAKMIKLQRKPAAKGASSDFNGDGRSDAAVADPYADPGGVTDAGQVTVQYGNSGNIGGGSVNTLVQGSDSVGNTPSTNDRFGTTLAAADLDNDGYTDLLVGTPYEDINGLADSGLAQIIWGSSSGLGKGKSSTQITRSGTSQITDAGAFTVVNDLYTGVVAGQAYDQSSTGIPGTPENNDRFGQVLDSVRSGSTTHLAVGIPFEAIGTAAKAGSVQLFSSTGTTITPGTGLTQDTSGVSETATANDEFGRRIALAPPGLGDTKTRLAVSAPNKDAGAPDAGQVQIFPLDDLGTEVTQNQTVSPPATNAHFGDGLGFVAGAGERSFLVGAPDAGQYGAVTVIPLPSGPPRTPLWIPGTGGVPSSGADRFGGAAGGEVQQ
jgi:Galactose oxidase-like, Early set domain/FG-GAP repeat